MKIIEESKDICIVIENPKHSILAIEYLENLGYKNKLKLQGNATCDCYYYNIDNIIECSDSLKRKKILFEKKYKIIYSNILFK